ncbi:MAG: methyltransferase domain-containing protein [Nitrospirae bacterium]|nr:methyltransferase domain-containing protein [Nitrospirota bacterium]
MSQKGYDAGDLQKMVSEAYSNVAVNPRDKHPFPVGRAFAESVGYSAELLDKISKRALDSFAGVSNVSVFADIPEGAVVVDVGCGAGLDTIIAALKTGVNGKVIGIDFSSDMVDCAVMAAQETGVGNVQFHQGGVDQIELNDSSADVVLANGIFNLNPNREAIFKEMYRILRPGGTVYASEIILKETAKSTAVCDIKNWIA